MSFDVQTLNRSAADAIDRIARRHPDAVHQTAGSTVVDAGLDVRSTLDDGIDLSMACMGGAATVSIVPPAGGTQTMPGSPSVSVHTSDPLAACLASQYAGWPVSVDDFFAMASGPMRARRGREAMLESLHLLAPEHSGDDDAVPFAGVLESTSMPSESVIRSMAEELDVMPDRVKLAVAPVWSLAGTVQVAARVVETAMHKLHALEFDVNKVVSASGYAPLPPPAGVGDMVGGIGRTNDAILYGGVVTMWVVGDDDAIHDVVDRIPSGSSDDAGRPFAEVFKSYDHDFYKVDPMLFSPAVIVLHNLNTGRTHHRGKLEPDILVRSFGL